MTQVKPKQKENHNNPSKTYSSTYYLWSSTTAKRVAFAQTKEPAQKTTSIGADTRRGQRSLRVHSTEVDFLAEKINTFHLLQKV